MSRADDVAAAAAAVFGQNNGDPVVGSSANPTFCSSIGESNIVIRASQTLRYAK